MTRNLNFQPLTRAGEAQDLGDDRAWRRRRREDNPTVQMSVRMPEAAYEQFRILCQQERRTNGDMLSVLMESYLARREEDAKAR